MTQKPGAQAVRCPIANVVGKWKDIHLEQAQREKSETPDSVRHLNSPGGESQESEPEPVLRIPDFQGSSTVKDGDLRASMDTCSQTVAWLAETMVEERLHTKMTLRRMENLLGNLQPGRPEKPSGSTQAKLSNASDIHILVSEEFKAHREWVADKFVKLQSQLMQQEANVNDVPRTSQAAPRDEDFETRIALMYRNSEDERHDQNASNSAAVKSDTTKQPSGSIASRTSVSCRSRLRDEEEEHARMVKRMEAMKISRKYRSLAVYLRECMGISEESLTDLKRKPSSCMVDVVDSAVFSTCSLSIVLLNAMWIGYQTETQMQLILHSEGPQDMPAWHNHVKRLFSIFFAIELIIRMATYRFYFFVCADKAWNLYDTLIVLGALSEELFDTINWNSLRALRVLRMVRVARMVRLLRFFQPIRYIIVSMLASTMMLGWTVLFMIFLMYIFAIIFMQGISIEIDRTDDVKMEFVAAFYGSLKGTMFTLLLAVTGGMPWHLLVDPLVAGAPALVPVFLIYIVVVLYGILNVVTAVFVDHTSELKDRDRDLAVHKEMSKNEAFATQLKTFYEEEGYCDHDSIDKEAFLLLLENPDMQMFLQTHSVDVSEAEELFNLLDAEDEGRILVDDFVFGCQRLKGAAKGMDVVLLYDQVMELKGHMVVTTDRQVARDYELRRNTDRIAEMLQRTTYMVEELADDIYASKGNQKRRQEII